MNFLVQEIAKGLYILNYRYLLQLLPIITYKDKLNTIYKLDLQIIINQQHIITSKQNNNILSENTYKA
jgi:hypothetical protein